MGYAYGVQQKHVTWRDAIGNDQKRLNELSSTVHSVVFKIGGTTKPYIQDRTNSYGEHTLLFKYETSPGGALYLEQKLRDTLIAIGYRQWQRKKDHFIIHRTKVDQFLHDAKVICNMWSEHIKKMEADAEAGHE
jgi:hypothetical protein